MLLGQWLQKFRKKLKCIFLQKLWHSILNYFWNPFSLFGISDPWSQSNYFPSKRWISLNQLQSVHTHNTWILITRINSTIIKFFSRHFWNYSLSLISLPAIVSVHKYLAIVKTSNRFAKGEPWTVSQDVVLLCICFFYTIARNFTLPFIELMG